MFASKNTVAKETYTPYALFAGGAAFGGGVTTTNKYKFINDTISTGTALSSTKDTHAAISNSTLGLMAGGSNSPTTTIKYTFTTNIVSSGTALGSNFIGSSGAGIAAYGLIRGGYDGGSSTFTTSKKYTYSGDTVTTHGALNNARRYSASASALTYAMTGGGNDSTPLSSTEKHTYATNINAVGTSLSNEVETPTAMSNSSTLYFIGGASTMGNYRTVDKYAISNGAKSTGTVLGTYRAGAGAAGDLNFGIVAGGSGGASSANNDYLNSTDKYTYSNNTVSSSVTLSSARSGLTGCSPIHGGL